MIVNNEWTVLSLELSVILMFAVSLSCMSFFNQTTLGRGLPTAVQSTSNLLGAVTVLEMESLPTTLGLLDNKVIDTFE
jgi:hypothetical protein